ncbi:MAG TPA: ROK family protein [Methylocystis sp.]|nr:ROK family protein [Methylocystis sp.]
MIRVGVDLGGTKIEAIALGPEGRTLSRRRVATPASDYDAILRAVVDLVAAIEQEAGGRGMIGVGTPGAISPQTHLVKNSNTVVLIGRPLAHDLALALNRVVRLENDANCFALSEAVDGAGAHARVVFGVILGTGVGGGIVIEGKLLKGHNRIAGEWGHNSLPRQRADEYPGPRCYCGETGCIETFLSGPALERDFRARGGAKASGAEIAALAEEGQVKALATLSLYQDRLARALASVVNIIDPDVIVLGGGVSNIARLYEGLEPLVERYAFTDALATKILRNVHGDSGGVRGAAWLWGAGEG